MRTLCLILAVSVTSGALSAFSQSSESGPLAVYASQFHGRPTASGGVYDRALLTAAHPSLPFGTLVRVANFESGLMVDVLINDRKGRDGRLLNLSEAAAKALLLPPHSVAPGSLMVVGKVPPPPVRAPGNGAPGRMSASPKPGPVGSGVGGSGAVSGKGKWQPRLFRPMQSPDTLIVQPPAPNRSVPELIPLNATTRPSSGNPPGAHTAPHYSNQRVPPITPAAAMVQISPAAPYRVQFGAFRRVGNATELSEMLGTAGVPTSVFASPDTGLNVVVSRAGFRSAEEAQRWIDYEGARRGWRERPVVIR